MMTERSGVEIDYCPECRGVWLDRGELDKILERASGAGTSGSNKYGDSPQVPYSKSGYKKKKPGSFLEDLFDF